MIHKPFERNGAVRGASATIPSTAALVLVVDDFEDNRAMYVEYLQFHGFRVAEAVNGLDAYERATELHPDVVVMDLSLPVVDGWEATRRIKADPRTKGVRVIALTGHAEPSHARRAFAAGCDDFVPKPCLPEVLLAKVRAHIDAPSRPSVRKASGSRPKQKAKP